MAQDDMHVVMYTILRYLYDCLKAGERPDITRISAQGLGINEAYWAAIVADLVSRGYVRGIRVFHESDRDRVQVVRPCVTVEGVEFMMENSMMQRALRFLQDAKGAMPFV